MRYPCFHCDVELVPGARFCHQCGSPVLLAGGRREAEAGVGEEERVRIKRDVAGAALTPAGTRGMQAVLAAPPRPARRPPPVPPLWRRAAAAGVWRRPAVWVVAAALALAVGIWVAVEDVRLKSREQSEVYGMVTRLLVVCPRNSRAELGDLIARIQRASGGQESLLDSALLFTYVARSAPIVDGDCARVAEALARPNRFDPLFR